MSAATYFLRPQCFVCRLQDYWIILDTKRDRYLCLAHTDLAAIGHRLHGWGNPRIPADECADKGDEEDSLIESLISRGILTGSSREGKPFIESEFRACESAFEAIELEPSVRASPLHVIRFFWSCGKVHWRLRFGAFARTVKGLERRRRHVMVVSSQSRRRGLGLCAVARSENHSVARSRELPACFEPDSPVGSRDERHRRRFGLRVQ